MTWVARLLKAWPLKKPGPGEGSGVDDGGNGTGLTDEDVICSCLNVTRATMKRAIEYEKPLPFSHHELHESGHPLWWMLGTSWRSGSGSGSRTESANCQKELALASLALGEHPSTSSE